MLNRELEAHISDIWQTKSRMEIEYEKLYLRLFLPHVRHGTRGARKRYAGLVEEDGHQKVIFTGMEVVRRDWTELARQLQRELYELLFHDQQVEDLVRQRVSELRDGRCDELLVYRKALRKDPASTLRPPHPTSWRRARCRVSPGGGSPTS